MNLSKDRQSAGDAIQWLSRTLAILVLMALPGGIGALLDNQFATEYLMPTGVILGFILGTGMLVFLAIKLTPKAGGDPIPFDEGIEEEESETAASAETD